MGTKNYTDDPKELVIELGLDDDCPCNTCFNKENCDSWEAKYCCRLCEYYGGGNCDECDPMDL